MKKFSIIVVVAIFFLSFFLRFHNYATYPQRGATSDEYTYSFLGVSLLIQHKPISWSFFEYPNRKDITINGIFFPIVEPYFDHPPLYGILVGGWSMLFNQNTFTSIDLKTIRIIPIILSMLASILLYLLGKKFYDHKTGLWALLIFVTTTFFVINMRVVVAENLLTVLFLTSFLLFYSSKKITTKKTLLLGILCGLAFWTKMLGIVVLFSILYFYIKENVNKKQITILISIFSLFFLGYIGYGMYYGSEIFWHIFLTQSARKIGPETLWNITLFPVIVNKVMYDGWYYLGFICMFFSFTNFQKNKAIIVPSAIYLLLLIFTLTKEGSTGWYMIPLFPFMSLAIAHVLREGIKQQSWGMYLFLLFIGLHHMKYIYEEMFGLTGLQFRIFLLLLFIPFFLSHLLKREKVYALLSNFWFYLFIFGNVIQTYYYTHPA